MADNMVDKRSLQVSLLFWVSWGRMRLRPLGTLATNWPILPAPDDT
jgi:hypothetical protein